MCESVPFLPPAGCAAGAQVCREHLVPFGSQTLFTFHLILTHKLNNHINLTLDGKSSCFWSTYLVVSDDVRCPILGWLL